MIASIFVSNKKLLRAAHCLNRVSPWVLFVSLKPHLTLITSPPRLYQLGGRP